MPNIPEARFSPASRNDHTLRHRRHIGVRYGSLAKVDILEDGTQLPSGLGDVFRHVGRTRGIPQSLDDLHPLQLQGDEGSLDWRASNQFGSRRLSQPAVVATVSSIIDP